MTRNQFLGAILAPVALLFRRKEVEPNPVIKNSRFKELKKIQARLDFLRKYPLTEKEALPKDQVMIIRGRKGESYYYYRGFDEVGNRYSYTYNLDLRDFRKKLIDQIPKFYGRKMKQFTN